MVNCTKDVGCCTDAGRVNTVRKAEKRLQIRAELDII
ncbi:hypothetical protein BACCAP_04647 [Pseudoflavonifractor capillosus ATCC 29799]|uniref:Uncharacterized protein n=1 Tax=Pseudoflavonifractor capillosus ATCC 29799 TaxID=411467 RepID=A6P2B7_9FIRM|nr:hypothetical protein BACCAP_04647 [Pseudoflavonifractor capillosus ATCC 29799]